MSRGSRSRTLLCPLSPARAAPGWCGPAPGREGLGVAGVEVQGPVEVPDRLVVAARPPSATPLPWSAEELSGSSPEHGVEVAEV